MPEPGEIRWHEITADRAGELVAKGHRRRSCFAHRSLFLPRSGPDGYKLAQRMRGPTRAASLWEVVLFAEEAALTQFPADLFFDDDLIWHRQHFGRPGQIAYADVVIEGTDMWSMSHVSDLVQRIGRRREHKTRIENRFEGWHDMLLNALLALAADRGVQRLRIATAQFQIRHTDPARTVQPELFERIYDRGVNRVLDASRSGDWWLVDVAANQARLTVPTVRIEHLPDRRLICVCHDVEAGLGHEGIDDSLAELANRTWRESVAAMLRVEHAAGLHATYNVVGSLLEEIRPEIEAGGHCLAFHSYDHHGAQLAACREVDYRIKGYRAPQSRITPELADEELLFHNFEWLSSSAYSFGFSEPKLQNGIVLLPVHIDDFDLHRSGLGFDAWKTAVVETVPKHAAAIVSLHDCYAHLWLEGYAELLDELRALGEVRTLDELAAELMLAAAV